MKKYKKYKKLTSLYNAYKNRNNKNKNSRNNYKRVIGIAQLCLSAVLKTMSGIISQ